MIASSVAIQNFPVMHLEDKASYVLQCMEDYDVFHFPVIKDNHLMGLVLKEDLLDIDSDQSIIILADQFLKVSIVHSAHFTVALNLFSQHQLSLLPVLNDQQEFAGVILQKKLNDYLVNFLGIDLPGAIIVVSIAPYQYSLAEVSRLVETNNAQITQLNTSYDELAATLMITIKLNKEDAGAIIASLQRYNYTLLYYFGNTPIYNELEDHYQHLMNYLDV